MHAIRRQIPIVLLLLVLLVLCLLATSLVRATRATDRTPGRTLADPYTCVVIEDGQGRPIDTICVPSPFAANAGGSV